MVMPVVLLVLEAFLALMAVEVAAKGPLTPLSPIPVSQVLIVAALAATLVRLLLRLRLLPPVELVLRMSFLCLRSLWLMVILLLRAAVPKPLAVLVKAVVG
jgi:hypothetical protein